jgi:23S rRNA (guanosine2251-2'-O)-methyltransferase
VKNYRQQYRPKKSSMVIGRQDVLEALQAGKQLDRIYLTREAKGMVIEEINLLAVKNAVPINYVPVAKLNGYNVSNHDGCIAMIAKVQYQDLQDVISFVVEEGRIPLFLILDGITDIRNIGGIARTAYCCGVDAIIIPDKGVGALNEDAILTSAGALEKIAICRVNSLMKTVDDLHMNGIKVYASEMTAEKTISDVVLNEPCAIVMGSEDNGIFPALMKVCDEKIKIPMAGGFESLNVSVATGIILYEVMRQRMA